MITTINVSGEMLRQADQLVEQDGYKSRSGVFRAGVKELIENRAEKLSGRTKCVLIMSHKKEREVALNRVKHKYEVLVETQVHTHLRKEMCTELFVLDGDGERINQLIRDFRKAGAAKMVLIP